MSARILFLLRVTLALILNYNNFKSQICDQFTTSFTRFLNSAKVQKFAIIISIII